MKSASNDNEYILKKKTCKFIFNKSQVAVNIILVIDIDIEYNLSESKITI